MLGNRLRQPLGLWLILLGMSAAAGAEGPLSARRADYEIDATLDAEARTLDGHLRLTWRNDRDEPTDELWFHLYWNAWRNNHSSWWRESRLGPRRPPRMPPGQWGFCRVDALRLLPAPKAGNVSDADSTTTDLTDALRFESPDDGNPDDRTVMVAALPRPVGPGETIRVEIEWHAKIPPVIARTGHYGDHFFFAHWFPKLGVYEPEGWNCHQFHAVSEFYSDYGVYDVTMTVPARYVVGATGRETSRRENGDGTVTHRYRQEDVHAFTWVAGPDYQVHEALFEKEGLAPVEMRLLLRPEHGALAKRHFDAVRVALEYFGTWYGAYPYGHLTIVDPPYGSGAEGMEYPTLVTGAAQLFHPVGGGTPEKILLHEVAHQFFYGIVGNNEAEHAWLDEGLTTFSEARLYDTVYGETRWVERYLRRRLPFQVSDIRLDRAVFGNGFWSFLRSGAATADAQSVPSYLHFPPTSVRVSYNKTALWLTTLERYLGWESLRQILSTYFERFKFRHARPEDFFAVANEVSGQDLSWFFDQVHGRSVVFDYAVDSVASFPAELDGLSDDTESSDEAGPARPDPDSPRIFRTEVVVRRHGGGIFPVDVLLSFEDGSELRTAWDGAERWRLFVAERPARIVSAVVDPERVLLLDVDFENNGLRARPGAGMAAGKWSSKWMIWLQEMLRTLTFFA